MDFKLSEDEIKKMIREKWDETIQDDISSTDIEYWVTSIVGDIVKEKFDELYQYESDIDELFIRSAKEHLVSVFSSEIPQSVVKEALKQAFVVKMSELSFEQLKELINNVS